MIGEQIEFRGAGRGGLVFWALLAVFAWTMGLAMKEPRWALFSAWPALMLARWALPSPVRHVSVEETGLLVTEERERFIDYDSIEGLRLGGRAIPRGDRGPRGPLEIFHPDGVEVLHHPTEARALYQFLLDQCPDSGSREVPAKLQKHLEEQLANFDDDLVWSYRARPAHRSPPSGAGPIPVLLAAAVWGAGGFMTRSPEVWIGFGLLLVLIDWVIRVSRKQSQTASEGKIRNRQDSGLIISPAGLAMRQGDLSGKLHWDEIKSITMTRGGSFKLSSADVLFNAIMIQVAGARFAIADIYDRPLACIHELIERTWTAGEE